MIEQLIKYGLDQATNEPQPHKELQSDRDKKPIKSPYVPGEFTDQHLRHSSYGDLVNNKYQGEIENNKAQGYPKSREDFTDPEPKKPSDLTLEAEEVYKKHKEMMNAKCPEVKKKEQKGISPYIAAAKNFILAKKLARENLEHEPLPDTIADAMYRKMQFQHGSEPGLLLKDGNYATGVGWKGYPGFGATRCTKMKVFRPKTGVNGKHILKNDRPSSVSSFDKKWRFIRQQKVTPIELAICWDLTPIYAEDEPKRPKHIDGSNGSQAPAVFSLIHTPKEESAPEETSKEEPKQIPCNGHNCGTESDKSSVVRRQDFPVAQQIRPKTAWQNEKSISNPGSVKSNNSSNNNLKRAKSAYNIQENTREKTSDKNSSPSSVSHMSNKKIYQSSPNLTDCSNSYKYCSKDCYKQGNKKLPNTRLCMACEMKNVKLKERPKSEYKMAFKAGVPNNKRVSFTSTPNKINLKVPKQRDPYSRKNYSITSLAPPFSLQRENRQDYPEHWRLASIYQHSYKPLHLRKRPLIASVFQ